MGRNAKLFITAVAIALGALPLDMASAAASPTVLTGDASSVGFSRAVLHGTVDPNGSLTHYRFEWGPTSASGSASPLRSAGSGSEGVSVQAGIKGLLPDTVYHYRLVASNGLGQASGAERTFKTKGHPPAGVATGPATQIGFRGATVTGTIDPNGEASTYVFQYGLTTAYGGETFRAEVPAGYTLLGVSAQIQGLSPGTVFHYRIVAFHGGLPSYGGDATFVTLPLRRRRSHLRAKTSPHRASRAPFAFTTAGLVTGAQVLPASARCSGIATVAFFSHRRRVALRHAPVQPDCSFLTHAGFRRLARRIGKHRALRLGVSVHFAGNAYLAPSRARFEHVVVVRR